MATGESTHRRQNLTFVEGNHAGLIRADLMHIDMLETGISVFLDLGQVRLRLRTADNCLSHMLFGHQFARLLEVWTGVSGELEPAALTLGS